MMKLAQIPSRIDYLIYRILKIISFTFRFRIKMEAVFIQKIIKIKYIIDNKNKNNKNKNIKNNEIRIIKIKK